MGVEQFESEETKTPFSNVWTLERVNQFEGIQVPLHVIDAIAGASFNETLQKIKNRPIAQAVSDPDRVESLRIEGNLAEMHRMIGSKFPRRDKLLDFQYGHGHTHRHGWGNFRNLTRSQYAEHADILFERTVNRTLIDAEIQDEKPFQTNFLKSLF